MSDDDAPKPSDTAAKAATPAPPKPPTQAELAKLDHDAAMRFAENRASERVIQKASVGSNASGGMLTETKYPLPKQSAAAWGGNTPMRPAEAKANLDAVIKKHGRSNSKASAPLVIGSSTPRSSPTAAAAAAAAAVPKAAAVIPNLPAQVRLSGGGGGGGGGSTGTQTRVHAYFQPRPAAAAAAAATATATPKPLPEFQLKANAVGRATTDDDGEAEADFSTAAAAADVEMSAPAKTQTKGKRRRKSKAGGGGSAYFEEEAAEGSDSDEDYSAAISGKGLHEAARAGDGDALSALARRKRARKQQDAEEGTAASEIDDDKAHDAQGRRDAEEHALWQRCQAHKNLCKAYVPIIDVNISHRHELMAYHTRMMTEPLAVGDDAKAFRDEHANRRKSFMYELPRLEKAKTALELLVNALDRKCIEIDKEANRMFEDDDTDADGKRTTADEAEMRKSLTPEQQKYFDHAKKRVAELNDMLKMIVEPGLKQVAIKEQEWDAYKDKKKQSAKGKEEHDAIQREKATLTRDRERVLKERDEYDAGLKLLFGVDEKKEAQQKRGVQVEKWVDLSIDELYTQRFASTLTAVMQKHPEVLNSIDTLSGGHRWKKMREDFDQHIVQLRTRKRKKYTEYEYQYTVTAAGDGDEPGVSRSVTLRLKQTGEIEDLMVKENDADPWEQPTHDDLDDALVRFQTTADPDALIPTEPEGEAEADIVFVDCSAELAYLLSAHHRMIEMETLDHNKMSDA